METTLVGLIISLAVPKLLELLKKQRWAFFVEHYAPIMNRVTAAGVALLTSIGVTWSFDQAAGRFIIDGLFIGQIGEMLLRAALNFAVQEVTYRLFVNKPSGVPPAARRGGLYLIPILLALGLSASCAKVTPELLAGEKGVRVMVLEASNKVEPLVCNPEARKILTAAPCLQLLDALEPAVDLAIKYNRALREGKLPPIAETIAAFDKLIDVIKRVIPDSAVKAAALQDLVLARVRAEGGK